jgi:hypothetical protein
MFLSAVAVTPPHLSQREQEKRYSAAEDESMVLSW